MGSQHGWLKEYLFFIYFTSNSNIVTVGFSSGYTNDLVLKENAFV